MALGLSATTPVRYRKHSSGKVEARMGIALFGSSNMNEEEMAAVGHDPFSNLWHDNYEHGFGATEEEALADLEKRANDTSEALWA